MRRRAAHLSLSPVHFFDVKDPRILLFEPVDVPRRGGPNPQSHFVEHQEVSSLFVAPAWSVDLPTVYDPPKPLFVRVGGLSISVSERRKGSDCWFGLPDFIFYY